MSNVKGRIAVDVQFTDSTSSEGVQSLKTITLQDATEYTTGKVAVVTGTCGTSGVTVSVSSPAYKNATGQDVTFTNIARFAFQATPAAGIISGLSTIARSKGDVCVWNADGFSTSAYSIRSIEGTASYTLVLYGT